ncbi:hypothetical protein vBAbaMD22_140 [Acinetobacter phage vB_AbaM_D22]|nr:hypothetical protein vBAbaMD22_140 [Acinetobacter phage vB_AbaM_D22]
MSYSLVEVELNHSNLTIENIQQARDDAQSEVHDIEEKLSELDEDLEEDKEEIEKLETKKSNLESDIEHLDDVLDEVGDEHLICDSDLQSYLKDFAEEIYYSELQSMPSTLKSNIDWDGVANDLSGDYTEIDIDGNTYHFRA